MHELAFPPSVLYGTEALTLPAVRPTYSGLKVTLPENIQLVSVNARDGRSDEVVVRFYHMFEADEHPTLSQVPPARTAWRANLKCGTIQRS